MLSPLEVERNELGYSVEEVRQGRSLRVIRRSCAGSDSCAFLIHGGGGRAGQFKHQIKALEAEINVVAFDFLGHGDSPKPNQPELYTADEHLEDLRSIYEQYKMQRNVFVAHCYGVIHMLRLLKWLSMESRLSEVAGVIMLAIGTNAPTSVGPIIKLPAFVLDFSSDPLEWLRPLARSASNATLFTPTTDPALIEFENSISNNNRMYVMKVLAADSSNQAVWEHWLAEGKDALSSGGIPRAIVCGDGDGVFLVSSCQNVKSLLDVPEEDFHVVKDTGHLAMLEKPVEVNSIVKEFLAANLF